jgi:hypothetical protein
LLAVFVVVLLLATLGPIPVARRIGHRGRRLTVLAWMGCAGLPIVLFGLLALGYDGYVEDNGSTPARTLDTAIPVLAVGVALALGAWWIALGDPRDGSNHGGRGRE